MNFKKKTVRNLELDKPILEEIDLFTEIDGGTNTDYKYILKELLKELAKKEEHIKAEGYKKIFFHLNRICFDEDWYHEDFFANLEKTLIPYFREWIYIHKKNNNTKELNAIYLQLKPNFENFGSTDNYFDILENALGIRNIEKTEYTSFVVFYTNQKGKRLYIPFKCSHADTLDMNNIEDKKKLVRGILPRFVDVDNDDWELIKGTPSEAEMKKKLHIS
jgi:hypothetical protein